MLDDPAFRPVGADAPDLLRGRCCPLARALAHVKARDGDVIHAGLLGVKAGWPDIDLGALFIRVGIAKMGIDDRLAVFLGGEPG